MPTSAEGRRKVLIISSHRDHRWLIRVKTSFEDLTRRGLVELWDDTKIQSGSQWREEIRGALESAKVAVLLISADFLASDFIAEDELPPLLAAAEKDGLLILPLILKASLFDETESLSKFQSVNPPSEPLDSLRASDQEAYLNKLARIVLETYDEAEEPAAPYDYDKGLHPRTTSVRFFPLIPLLFISSILVLIYWFSSYLQYPSPPAGIIRPPSIRPSPTPTLTPPPSKYEEKLMAEARKKFPEGEVAFKPPKEMELNRTETFEVRITGRKGSKALIEGLPGAGTPQRDTLKIGFRMRVRLAAEADDFKITPITTEDRLLDSESPYEPWKWFVTPLKPEEHEMHLVAEAKADLPGIGERPLYVKTYVYKIKVNVNEQLAAAQAAKPEVKQGGNAIPQNKLEKADDSSSQRKDSDMGTASWVFGSILLAFAIGIVVFRLLRPQHPIDPTTQRILGILCALLVGLFTFFLTGDFTAEGSVLGLSIRAAGGAATFVLVLLWWRSDQAPIAAQKTGAETNPTIEKPPNT